jgi:hypothetical protein
METQQQNVTGSASVQKPDWRAETRASTPSRNGYDPRIAGLARELEEKREHRINKQKALECATSLYQNLQRKIKVDEETSPKISDAVILMAKKFEAYLKE